MRVNFAYMQHKDLGEAIEGLKQQYKAASDKIISSMSKEDKQKYKSVFSKLDNAVRKFEDIDPNKLFNEILKDVDKGH